MSKHGDGLYFCLKMDEPELTHTFYKTLFKNNGNPSHMQITSDFNRLLFILCYMSKIQRRESDRPKTEIFLIKFYNPFTF